MKSSTSIFSQLKSWCVLHPRKAALAGVCAAALVLTAASVLRVKERIYFNWVDMAQASTRIDNAIWLPDYRVDLQALPVAGVPDDLSGITYDYDQNRLLAITNSGPMQIVAMDKSANVLASYPLIGFKDTEDITYMGDGLVAVVEERSHSISFLTMPATPGPINRNNARNVTLGLNQSDTENKGLEGIAYDAVEDRLYAVKERDPRQLFAITGVRESLAGNLQLEVRDLSEWLDRSVYSTDLSAVHVDPVTGHLLLLSDESKALFELNSDGDLVSSRTFLSGLSDVKESVPQAEGVTMDTLGNLYVISEPNLFYSFSKKPVTVAQH
ncbi:MAG: SdiA-regulated domain-containing protein [Pseudomonas marincola]|uniref:SdiA-regulated domain-containing protein n=1 Tax=Pseudomonas marincola TaxID=437900 RepID=UPI0030014507